MNSRPLIACALALLAGCLDGSGSELFGGGPELSDGGSGESPDGGGSGGQGSGGQGEEPVAPLEGEECVPLGADDLKDTTFYGALSFSVAPERPLMFMAGLSTGAGEDGVVVDGSIVYLDKSDLVSPINGVGVREFIVEPDGTFMWDLDGYTIPAEANPLDDSGMKISLWLTGRGLCSGARFICGSISGEIVEPYSENLDGSTFTLQLPPPEGGQPELIINCEGDIASF